MTDKVPQLDTSTPAVEASQVAPKEGQVPVVETPKTPEELAKEEAKAKLDAAKAKGDAEVKGAAAEKRGSLMGEVKDGELADALGGLGRDFAYIFDDWELGRTGSGASSAKAKAGEAGSADEEEREEVESKEFGELMDPKAKVFSFPKLVDNEEVNSRVTSRKGHRKAPKEGASTEHKGDDIGVPVGTPIIFTGAEGATVKRVSTQRDGKTGEVEGGGHNVLIELPDGSTAHFMHLRELPALKEGQVLEAGDLIAYSGNSGTSTGPHLHFEVRQDGVAVEPEPWLAERYQKDHEGDSRLA